MRMILLSLFVFLVTLGFLNAQNDVDRYKFSDDVFLIDTITIKNPIYLEYKFYDSWSMQSVWTLLRYKKKRYEVIIKMITSKDKLSSLCSKYNGNNADILLDDDVYYLQYGIEALTNSFNLNTSFDIKGIFDVYHKTLGSRWGVLAPKCNNKCNDKISYSDDYPSDEFAVFLYRARNNRFFQDSKFKDNIYLRVAVPIIKDIALAGKIFDSNADRVDTLGVFNLKKEGYKLLHIYDSKDGNQTLCLMKSDSLVKKMVSPDIFNKIEVNRSGFKLYFEHGMGEYGYSQTFNFKYKDSNYFLTKTHTTIYDFSIPNKPRTVKKKTKSNIPIDKFKVEDYL